MNSNCSNLVDLRNLQEQVKKAFCYQKLFWPFTFWINCSSDLKNFAYSWPSASNFKNFSWSLEEHGNNTKRIRAFHEYEIYSFKSKIRKISRKIIWRKELLLLATWEMSLKFIINYTAASRAVGDRNQELGARFWLEREGCEQWNSIT